MAYVGITLSLKETTCRIIEGLKNNELKLLGGEPDLEEVGKQEWVEQYMWGDLYDIRDRLERLRITKRYTYLTMRVKDDVQDRPEFSTNIAVINAPVMRYFDGSPYLDSYARAQVRYDICPEVQAWYEWRVQRHECEERWKKVEAQVLSFLNQCKSLNEALKLWPDVEKFIHRPFIDKVNQKAERPAGAKSKAAEFASTLDMDQITASVVAARMGQSVA